MKLIAFSTRRRVTVTMFVVAAVVFGLVAFRRLAINLLPDITYPTLTVRTEYEGTAPSEMERLVTEPVEGAVGVVTNVVRVSSTSRPGVSEVVVEFSWGTDMDFASLDVREKLDRLQLPQGAEKPVLLRFDPSLDPIMRIGLYGPESLVALRLLAEEHIKLDLESLEGVAAARVNGGLEEEIHIELDEPRMASLRIPVQQVVVRLGQENVNLTGGQLKDGEAEYVVRTVNEFRSVEEIQDIVVGERQDAAITLADVGRVFRGHKERQVINRMNGRESVELAVYKEGDANTVTVADRVTGGLERFKKEAGGLPSGTRIEVVFSQATFIRGSVAEVLNTAIMGGVLAVLVLYLFLGNPRSTVIISLSIPISVVCTFLLMFSSDVSLNIMSLGGLALGIGMLVDNSIVVLESVQRYREEGLSSPEATVKGASEVGKAVVASTLTTICVFVPIVFVEGIAGQLFRDQALTVTFSLVASLLVALTLIPMLASIDFGRRDAAAVPARGRPRAGPTLGLETVFGIFLRAGRGLGRGAVALLHPVFWLFERILGSAYRFYPRVIGWALGHRAVVIVVALALAGVSGLLAGFLGSELIPEMSQGEFSISVDMPVGTPLVATERTIRDMERIVQAQPEVELVYSTVGLSGSSDGAAGEERENVGQIHVALNEGIIRAREDAVMERLRQAFRGMPAAECKFARPSFFSSRTPVEVEISGYSLGTLRTLSDELAGRLEDIPGLVDVKTSAEGGNPEVQIRFNRKWVAQMGTSINEIGRLVRNKIHGEVATEFAQGDRKVDIRVRADERHRATVEDLKRLIVSPAGASAPIPLAVVADLSVEMGPAEILRADQERVAVVSANLEGRSLSEVVADIESVIRDMHYPPDYHVKIGGQNEERKRSFESMQLAILLAVFLVYLVMASQFESLVHPFVIMFSIPFGLVGVVWMLLVTGQTVSVVVLIGLIMLAGIVVNNAIVLIDYINALRRERGMGKREAIERACQVRLRPILMTTSTTVLGLMPMALGVFDFRPFTANVESGLANVLPGDALDYVMGALNVVFPVGQGAEIRAPMAITVIGGLVISTLVTLVLIPTLYSLVDRRE
ncbi:MAG: efflux RND transporter permease subunit [Candidatus Latescibacteria bacterium]|nr:efflux RND transporter permease subunit [Candidatus Latescibacterota bacterium]